MSYSYLDMFDSYPDMTYYNKFHPTDIFDEQECKNNTLTNHSYQCPRFLQTYIETHIDYIRIQFNSYYVNSYKYCRDCKHRKYFF